MALGIALKYSERPISFSFRQRTWNQSSAAADIELNLKFRLHKIGDGAKISAENTAISYRIPKHFFSAASQNLRRPFRQYKQGAKTEAYF